MCDIPIKMLKQRAIPNSTELKDLFIKMLQKNQVVEIELYV